MKTSIIYHPWSTEYHRRAYLQSEAPDESSSKYRTFHIARFWRAHTESGERIVNFDFKNREPFTRKVPDALDVGGNVFKFQRGMVERARIVPDEYIAELDRLDNEIAALQAKQRQLVEEAWNRGRPIKKSDLYKERTK